MFVVDSPFPAHQQGADQLDELSAGSIENDRFFHDHIFVPHSVFQKPTHIVVAFLHFIQYAFQLFTLVPEILCRVCQLCGVQFFFIFVCFIRIECYFSLERKVTKSRFNIPNNEAPAE